MMELRGHATVFRYRGIMCSVQSNPVDEAIRLINIYTKKYWDGIYRKQIIMVRVSIMAAMNSLMKRDNRINGYEVSSDCGKFVKFKIEIRMSDGKISTFQMSFSLNDE